MNQWNVGLYEQKHSYVWEYGAQILEMLSPQATERILDLGCGTGQLTAEIARSGAEVVGLDRAESAIAKAQANYPELEFRVGNGADFSFQQPFDAVFSNAALHWIHPREAAVKCIWQALKSGGRFVAEFGGQGNVGQIVEALNNVLVKQGCDRYNPWYFPSIGEYSTLLEQQGFTVINMSLLDRPTKLEGETGLANWLAMFAGDYLSAMDNSSQQEIINQVESQLRPSLYRQGDWIADYKRIRVMAIAQK